MKKYFIKVLFFSAFVLLGFLVCPRFSFAKNDLSISDTDIVLSKDNLVAGQTVRIYARIFNNGDTDVYGFVMFYANGKELNQPQPISVRTNNYDDVFIDWVAVAGTFDLEAKIINTNPTDENLNNNTVTKKNIFVDTDANKNGVGDKQEQLNNSAANAANQNSAKSSDQNSAFSQTNSGSNPLSGIINSVERILGIKNTDNNTGANSGAQIKTDENKNQNKNGWITTLQGYLDSASQKVKTSPDYNKYFLPALLGIFVILLIFFGTRRKKR